MKINYYIFIFLNLISFCLLGQKKEKITYKADELKFRRINKEPVRKLINNVVFIQGNTEIKCDSANFYNKKNEEIKKKEGGGVGNIIHKLSL